ncbi:MAG: metal-sensing transcriptional repressor [Bacilli bacterium]|nr:metal-sensing transcriptional repressor [Bacilli bacterium]
MLGGIAVEKEKVTGSKQELITRLNRLEGQIRGIKQMINDDRECDDILIQISAIINSLKGFSKTILKEHLSTKIVDDLKNGKIESVEEVITLFSRIN